MTVIVHDDIDGRILVRLGLEYKQPWVFQYIWKVGQYVHYTYCMWLFWPVAFVAFDQSAAFASPYWYCII